MYDNLGLPADVARQIPSLSRYGIDTPIRLCHFLAQCAHESANFTRFVENLNYSKEGLLKTFPKYFDEATAAQYHRQAERIANRVYASRMGNGNEASGDGWRFRGRGAIQMTGRSNYESFFKDFPGATADQVSAEHSLTSAGWFWNSAKLNAIADKGWDDQTITAVTRRANGGTHGLADRIAKFRHYEKLLKPTT